MKNRFLVLYDNLRARLSTVHCFWRPTIRRWWKRRKESLHLDASFDARAPQYPRNAVLAMAAAEPPPVQTAQALVDFSLNGSFPEDTVSSLPIDAESLPAAIKALADAKAKLQVRAHTNRGLLCAH